VKGFKHLGLEDLYLFAVQSTVKAETVILGWIIKDQKEMA